MSDQPRILVVGSINMDVVMRTVQMPAPGETVRGKGFSTSPGGKGANQAVAAARLGARCHMLGRVGDDAFGHALVDSMIAEGINCDNVMITEDAATGAAMILVDNCGENAIVTSGGANRQVTPDDIFGQGELFEQADVVLLQLELPLPTVRAAVDLARRHRCKVVLDPAPAPRPMPEELFQVDILSPNAVEAEHITGKQAVEERADRQVASELVERGAGAAVLKLGPRGAIVVSCDGEIARVRPYRVNVVDTTGAGDAFTGALAVAVGRGQRLAEATQFANAAGALTCTKLGAQLAIPTCDEVRILMQDQPQ